MLGAKKAQLVFFSSLPSSRDVFSSSFIVDGTEGVVCEGNWEMLSPWFFQMILFRLLFFAPTHIHTVHPLFRFFSAHSLPGTPISIYLVLKRPTVSAFSLFAKEGKRYEGSLMLTNDILGGCNAFTLPSRQNLNWNRNVCEPLFWV
jgi:hypothetical protein